MLERARRCSNVIAKDPLDDAKRWGITITTVEKVIMHTLSIKINKEKIVKKKLLTKTNFYFSRHLHG